MDPQGELTKTLDSVEKGEQSYSGSGVVNRVKPKAKHNNNTWSLFDFNRNNPLRFLVSGSFSNSDSRYATADSSAKSDQPNVEEKIAFARKLLLEESECSNSSFEPTLEVNYDHSLCKDSGISFKRDSSANDMMLISSYSSKNCNSVSDSNKICCSVNDSNKKCNSVNDSNKNNTSHGNRNSDSHSTRQSQSTIIPELRIEDSFLGNSMEQLHRDHRLSSPATEVSQNPDFYESNSNSYNSSVNDLYANNTIVSNVSNYNSTTSSYDYTAHTNNQSDIHSNTNSNTNIDKNKNSFMTRIRNWKRIVCEKRFYMKVAVLISLSCSAIFCGVFIFELLKAEEIEAFENSFSAVSRDALSRIDQQLQRSVHGTRTVANMFADRYSNSSEWPCIADKSFLSVSNSILDMEVGTTLVYSPLVLPDDIQTFNNYAFEYFKRDKKLPINLGEHSFGKGIFKGNPFQPTETSRLDTDGVVANSNSTILAPLFQIATPIAIATQTLTLYNLRDDEFYRSGIDEVIECSEKRKQSGNPNTKCGIVSDFNPRIIVPPGVDISAKFLQLQPIFPSDNSLELTGIVSMTLDFANVLNNVLGDHVDGIDCVIDNGQTQFTYKIYNGKAVGVGYGIYHHTRYESYKKVIVMTRNEELSEETPTTTITFYPCDVYYNRYNTNNPLYVSFTVVVAILLSSIIFFMYDFFMKRESIMKEQVIEAKRQYVRFISHEVRTPLNSVSMGICLLIEELKSTLLGNEDNNQNRSWLSLLEDVSTNVSDAIVVLNDLLNYDKIESGSLSLEVMPVDVLNMTKVVSRSFIAAATNVGVSLHFVCPTIREDMDIRSELDSFRCLGDETRLSQVLRNLISNAIKFTPEGGTVTVRGEWVENGLPNIGPIYSDKETEVECKYPRAGSIRISVVDTGAGLNEEQLNKIFGEGVQFNPNILQAGQGSGLGLYISKGIVERHQGKVAVSSEGLGEGTTFTVELPVYAYPKDNSSTRVSKTLRRLQSKLKDSIDSYRVSNSKERRSTRKRESKIVPFNKKILVVDDSLSNRKILSLLLKKRGYEVEEATNGQEALDLFITMDENGKETIVDNIFKYHCILMDFEMPIMNGPTATKKLRDLGCDCLIVGITGNVLPADVKFFKDHGADEVLPKPLKIEDFLKIWSSKFVQ